MNCYIYAGCAEFGKKKKRSLILCYEMTETHSVAKSRFANLRRFGLKLQVRSDLFKIVLCEEAEGG